MILADVPLIPRHLLFGNPEKVFPLLAPDGRQMAYGAPHQGALNIWLKTVGQEDDRVLTQASGSNIGTYFWSADSRAIFFTQDKNGDENSNLYRIDLASGATDNLTPFAGVRAQLIKRSQRYPNSLLIGLNKEDARFHDAYRLDLVSGRLEMAAKNWGQVRQWLGDADLQVRAAVVAQADGGFALLVRDSEGDEWRQLVSWDAENALTSGPLAFTADGRSLYLYDSRHANTTRLVKLALSGGKPQVIAADPHYDVTSALINPHTHTLEAIAFQRERLVWQPLTAPVAADLAVIPTIAKGDFRIGSRDEADRTWLVGFWPDDGPIAYYAYDRQSRQATFLFHHQAALTDYPLATMQPIAFAARDGLTIHGYITFPPHLPPVNLPLVVNVHGGPWSRDQWGFDPQAQWLANRGYICLQVNYRGSSGYGRDFLNAGNREWGGKMQADLADAVTWAFNQGYADPGKIAIYGGSYGGYAALMAAANTRQLFCCAIAANAPVNLVTFLQSLPPYWEARRPAFYHRVGNPETEANFLLARSPITHAEQISIPLLIVQGANDPRVKVAEAEQLVAVLKEKGIPYQYLLFPDEGHGLAKPDNRLAFYGAAEEFLARHLHGRFEPL
jgi:dipeptidyl aminopeptidase/acylaminoacyl peptidase